METKTIKIEKSVHRELKVFAARNGKESMIDFAGLSIMKELAARGHKFETKKQVKQ